MLLASLCFCMISFVSLCGYKVVFLVLDFWFWIFGFGFLVLDFWFWIFGFGFLVLCPYVVIWTY